VLLSNDLLLKYVFYSSIKFKKYSEALLPKGMFGQARKVKGDEN